jgi:diketogulonate reductase-like aldo/keto reductase
MAIKDVFQLSNGVSIPAIGLGTWMIEDNEVDKAVKKALELGYRHVDTAQAYANEAGVGKGVLESGVAREDIFVTSKVHAGFKTYESAKESIDNSLKVMGLDYIDLMIIHAPQPWEEWRADSRYFEENKEVWRALEEAYKEGKLKAIGVSNFLQDDLENLLESATVKPMVNQILTHISNTPKDLIDFCQSNDILVEAYSPIAHGEALKNPDIIEMAKKYNVSVPQLCIRYVVQLGAVALPKTANPKHMEQNADVDFVISKEDMEILLNVDPIENYGDASMFPVFSGK